MSRDYLPLASEYEAAVMDGTIPACAWVKKAVERNVRDKARQGTPEFPYRLDTHSANAICQAAESLPHIKGPKAIVVGRDEEGRPLWNTIELELWEAWFLTTLFGWRHVKTGLRRFRSGLVLVPRKNAKSTLGAIIALYMLTADGESGADIFSAATTRDQAKVVAEIVWEMARRSQAFRDYFGVRVGAKTTRVVEVPETASKFMPLSADAHSLDGLNVHCGIVDELHAHPTRAVWDVLDTATGARSQPMLLAITTAGVDIGGICYEKRTYMQKVLSGVHDDEQFFGVEYSIDEGDDWREESSWRKANPNYGVSVSIEDLQRKAREASQSSAGVNNFLTKHLNVWVRSESTWLPLEQWQKNGDIALTPQMFKQYPCWIGVDLAEVRDIAAVVTLFRISTEKFVVFGKYYLPEAAIQKSPVAQYSGWVREEFLTETDGDQADYQRIEDDIYALCQTLKVESVCFDRALAAQMGQSLTRRLGSKPEVVTVNQNVETMNPSMQMCERLILSGGLPHDNNPCMTWMMSNVVVQRNHKDEIYPRKAGGKDSPNKIDGPVALFTAMSQAALGPKDVGVSFFVAGGRRA